MLKAGGGTVVRTEMYGGILLFMHDVQLPEKVALDDQISDNLT